MTHTVLIPVFNTPGNYLTEAVNSMLNQKGVETDVLIVNDGSSNIETLDCLSKLSQHDRCRVVHLEKNLGTPAALNTGHRLIDTEFTILMGSDDISHPDRVRLQLEYLKKHPNTDVLGTWLTAFKQSNGTEWFRFEMPEYPKPGMNNHHHKFFLVNHGTVIYRNAKVLESGGYNEAYKRGQDCELWQRMYAKGAIFRNLTKQLYRFRRPNH